MSKEEALSLAKELKRRLIEAQIPLRDVLLFGSAARDEATEDSDIDIAVVCDPFLDSKHDECVQLWKERRPVDLRIEIVCFHPNDFEDPMHGLAQEVKEYGIAV